MEVEKGEILPNPSVENDARFTIRVEGKIRSKSVPYAD